MLKEGQEFIKDGLTFCLLKMIDYNNKKYALFSIESQKLVFQLYEVKMSEDGYELEGIKDENLQNTLLDLVGAEKDE